MVLDLQDTDTLRFESSQEIDRIILILNEWQREHGADATANEMIEKLELIRIAF